MEAESQSSLLTTLISSTMRKIIPIGARYPFVTLAINELTVLTNIMNRDAAVNLRK
ncbi:MAG: hypothetical protein GXW91_00970 [Clostridiales bacterium]|nr:hypothetical protein [Clostridiales bacterium]